MRTSLALGLALALLGCGGEAPTDGGVAPADGGAGDDAGADPDGGGAPVSS